MFELGSRLSRLPAEAARLLRSPGTWAVLIGAAIILPFLGSSGLWDPWETHYAEVARRMVVDGDWLTPRWRHELFFSKPVLIFWMMAGSFKLFGVCALAARIPFALIGILGVYLAYRMVARTTSPRKGLWAAVVMATCPFYFFIARQAITDIVFCVFILGSLSCFMIVAISKQPKLRDVLGIYIFAALAALGKTPIGLAIPILVVLAYLLLSGDWRVLKKVKLHLGIPLFFLIAAPWYVTMLVMYKAKFYNEFFIHHNVQRAFTGVHGDRATFDYFIKQMGYGFFPWVALLPVAFGRIVSKLGSLKPRPPGQPALLEPECARRKLDLFLLVWFVVTFATFTLIVTKFHHYVFPALPPLAILTGLALAERNKTGWLILGPLGVLVLAMVTNDIVSSQAHLSNLHSYAYDRPLPNESYPRWILFGIAAAVGSTLVVVRFIKDHKWVSYALGGLGGVCALLLAWFYQPALGHTMSQQDLFDSYAKYAKPGEKLYQYQMNWRGEVFYSADTIIKLSSETAVRNILKQDKRMFIIAVSDGFAAVDRAARVATGKHLHVLPGSNIRYTLASNRLDPGVEDQNPLSENVFSEPPEISHPLLAEFQEGAAFLGYDVEPESPEIGDEFELTLYWKCLKPIGKSWQVFVHIDGHGHEFHRIHGDHYPLKGLFTTDRWMKDDIIRDKIKLKIPIEFSPGRFTVYVGFYSGDPRMKVLPGFPQDGSNRVRAGTLIFK
ncbi:MAG: glycosyltransferase family 39 protein [Deltaproteobacteria bacterium]|nr:glycosyltransferase family 39 protein [Deltaproteobacteria bacterium]